jgi:hypothetical protein
MAVFWVVAPCSLVALYKHFGKSTATIFKAKVITQRPNVINSAHKTLNICHILEIKVLE